MECKRCGSEDRHPKFGYCLPCAREHKRNWKTNNPVRVRAHRDNWKKRNPGYTYTYKTNPLKARRREWKRQGIDVEVATALLSAHNGRCDLCDKDKPGGRGGWHIDHDHTTGRVRGVLCHRCNTFLGWYENHKISWTALARYLGVEDESSSSSPTAVFSSSRISS